MSAPITYLYRCFDREGQLLYAGITDDVERRKREHAKDKFWWPDVTRVTRMAFQTRIEALWAEWAVITTCNPIYNRSTSTPPLGDFAQVTSTAPAAEVQIADEAVMVSALRPFVASFRVKWGKAPGQQSARDELKRLGYRVGTRRAGELATLADQANGTDTPTPSGNALAQAVAAVLAGKLSCRAAAATYGLSAATVTRHVRRARSNVSAGQSPSRHAVNGRMPQLTHPVTQ